MAGSLRLLACLLLLAVHSCGASTPAGNSGTTEPASDGISLSFVMVGVDPQQVQNSTLRAAIAQVAGTEPSAVGIDSVQYQVAVDLGQRPDGQRRRLLAGGAAPLLVTATVHAVNLAAVDSALTASNASSQLDAALRKQLGASLSGGTLKVAAPSWATSTAPAPAPGAPAVGIQFIMTGVSVAQLNQTQLRIAIAELAGVPFTAVSVSRVSYAVSAATPPTGRRLRRLLADGYSTLQVEATILAADLQVSKQVLIGTNAQDILARLLQEQLGATYVAGSLQLAASASITAPAPGAASASAPSPAAAAQLDAGHRHGITRAEIIATAVVGGFAVLALVVLAAALCLMRRARASKQVASEGKDDESTGDDLELGQRIASKLSGSKHGPSTEPAMWINSSLTDAQSPAGRVTVGVKSSPHAKDAKVDDSGVHITPITDGGDDGWILNTTYAAAAVDTKPSEHPAPANDT